MSKIPVKSSLVDRNSQFIARFSNQRTTCVKLEEVAQISSGLTKNSKRPQLPLKMKYLRVANVLFNDFDLSDVQLIGVQPSEIDKCSLQEGDLLFVEGNGSPDQIGRVSVWNGCISPILHQNHIIKARFIGNRILPHFAMYYFMTQEGRQQILDNAATTSGLYTLSQNKISNFIIPAPSIETQTEFLQLTRQSDKSKFAALNVSNLNLSLSLAIQKSIPKDLTLSPAKDFFHYQAVNFSPMPKDYLMDTRYTVETESHGIQIAH